MSTRGTVPRRRVQKEKQTNLSSIEKPIATDPGEDLITVAIESDAPVSFLENPDEVIPPGKIPERLRKAILETYGERVLNETVWTRKRLRQLHKAIVRPRENLTNTIAQICSPTCSQKDTCPYDIIGKAPAGERCPIELKIAELSYQEYVRAVAVRLNLSEQDVVNDIILHNLISGLVESDMVEARLNARISREGFTTEVPVVVNQQTGEVYFREDESVAVRIKERVARRKDQLYRQLLATPEMEERYKRKEGLNSMQQAAVALEQLIQIVSERKKLGGNS